MKRFLGISLIAIATSLYSEPVHLTFNEVISLALSNYEQIQLEKIKQDESYIHYKRQKSKYTPTVNLDNSFKVEKHSNSDNVLGLNFKQPLVDIPKIYDIRAAARRYEEVYATSEYAVDRLLFDIGKCYLEVIQKEEVKEIQIERFSLAQQQVESTKELETPSQEADLIRAESELSKAKRLILEAKEEYDSKKYELAVLIGLESSDICLQHLDLAWDIPFEKEEEISELIDQALGCREDLKGQYYKILKVHSELNAQKARRLPVLSVKGSTEWDIEHTNSAYAAFNLSLPIWNPRISLDVCKKRLEKTKAILEYRKLRKEIAISLTNLWRRARTELTRWQSTRDEVNYERKNYTASRKLFEKGKESSLDMINVINRYTDAKINVVSNEFAFYIAIWDLYTQLGEFQPFIEKHLNYVDKSSCSTLDLPALESSS